MDLHSQEIQEKKKDLQNQLQTIKKMAMGTYISIITSNVNRLNASTKDTDWLNGFLKRPIYILSTRNHLRPKDTYRLKMTRWKNIFHAYGKQKKAGVTILK